MNYIERKVGVAMAAFLAMAEAGGDEAPVTLPELVVTATPADVGYKADTTAVTGKKKGTDLFSAKTPAY